MSRKKILKTRICVDTNLVKRKKKLNKHAIYKLAVNSTTTRVTCTTRHRQFLFVEHFYIPRMKKWKKKWLWQGDWESLVCAGQTRYSNLRGVFLCSSLDSAPYVLRDKIRSILISRSAQLPQCYLLGVSIENKRLFSVDEFFPFSAGTRRGRFPSGFIVTDSCESIQVPCSSSRFFSQLLPRSSFKTLSEAIWRSLYT